MEYAQFGFAVSTDGVYIAVGAPYHGTGSEGNAGRAYVYRNGFYNSASSVVIRAPDADIADYFGTSIVVFGCV